MGILGLAFLQKEKTVSAGTADLPGPLEPSCATVIFAKLNLRGPVSTGSSGLSTSRSKNVMVGR